MSPLGRLFSCSTFLLFCFPVKCFKCVLSIGYRLYCNLAKLHQCGESVFARNFAYGSAWQWFAPSSSLPLYLSAACLPAAQLCMFRWYRNDIKTGVADGRWAHASRSVGAQTAAVGRARHGRGQPHGQVCRRAFGDCQTQKQSKMGNSISR